MKISAVVAVAKDGVIGRAGGLPWYLPADLAHFKEVTMGRPIIMGRKTYESIGRALPGRQNIIISRDSSFKAEGCQTAGSLDVALALAKDPAEVCVIGGQAIFELAMPKLNRIYLTRIDADIAGDKYFRYDPAEWDQSDTEAHSKDDKNRYDYEFITLDRKT